MVNVLIPASPRLAVANVFSIGVQLRRKRALLPQILYPSENLRPGSFPNPIQFSLVRGPLSPHRPLRSSELRREVVTVDADLGRFIVDHSTQRGLVTFSVEVGGPAARGAAVLRSAPTSKQFELHFALDALHRLGVLIFAMSIGRLLACRATKLRRPPCRRRGEDFTAVPAPGCRNEICHA